MTLLNEVERAQLKTDLPQFRVGDTVRVHFRIVEGEKERIQIFEGVVISRKGGEGANARFTVRRVVYNEGVERVFPLHSPRVETVEVVREGHVRRAKLYYLRGRSGKRARVRAKARTGEGRSAAAGAATVSNLDTADVDESIETGAITEEAEIQDASESDVVEEKA